MIISNHTSSPRSLFLSGILACSCLLGAIPYALGTTTVDPTTFASDADLSTATSGVVLSAPNNGLNMSVFADPVFGNATSGNRFGQTNVPGGYYDSFDSSSPLRATFTTPIASVTVRFGIDAPIGSTGFGSLTAFDIGGLALGPSMTTLAGGGDEVLTWTGPNISYILAYIGGNLGASDFAGITRLDFDPATASAPDGGSTVALLGLAIAGLGVLSRKANRA